MDQKIDRQGKEYAPEVSIDKMKLLSWIARFLEKIDYKIISFS